MAELADALDLGSSGLSRAGSSPVIRTTPAVSKSCTAGFLLLSFLPAFMAGIFFVNAYQLKASTHKLCLRLFSFLWISSRVQCGYL